jgi:Rha family phage regulatory protein
MNSDLFPETLLVDRDGDRIYTTSRKVAEHFHKRHDHVMRAIRALVAEIDARFDSPILGSQTESDSQIFGSQTESEAPALVCQTDFSRLNFQPSKYKNKRGKIYPMVEMTHDGFALLAMGFTGAEALMWKVDFLNAFRTQERALAQLTARYAHVVDVIRPCLRPTVEGTEQGLSRSAIGEPLGKSPASITYHRRRARELGLLEVLA